MAAPAESQPEEAVGVRVDGEDSQEPVGERKFDEYYSKWDKVAAEAISEVEASDAQEAQASTTALGLDSDAPRSESEKRDREKRGALKEAKKNWDGMEAKRAESKMVISDESSQAMRPLDFEGDLSGKRVLVFKNNTDCSYELGADLDRHNIIKLYIDHCTRCTVVLHCKLVTSLVEICHCEGCTVEVRHPTHTFQIDLCEGTHLWFGQNVLLPGHKIYSAGNRGLKITYDDRGEQASSAVDGGECKRVLLDNFALSALPEPLQAAEQQFVTQLTNLSKTDTKMDLDLQTEPVTRDAGMQPTTTREIEDRKDEIATSLRERGIDEGTIARSQKRLDAPSADSEAQRLKEEGNKAFKECHYVQASVYYVQALQAIEREATAVGMEREKKKKVDEEASLALDAIRLACYGNRAACQLKLGAHPEALADAEQGLAIDPEHVKCNFRRGLALHAMGRSAEACPNLGKALAKEPKNKQIKEALLFAERGAAKQVTEANRSR